jgi:hypothetical protein
MRNSLLILLFSSILFLSSSLFAQNETIRIKSKDPIVDINSNKKIEGVSITIFKDGKKENVINTGTSGKFDFSLVLGYSYDLEFSQEKYLSKIIRIDTRDIPKEEMEGGYQIEFDFSLYKYVDGFNLEILREPTLRAYFDPVMKFISFDFDYADSMNKKIEEEFKRLKAIEEK